MPEWEDHAKIHEGCGGLVRWVEAVLTPGVGYTGECLECGHDRVVQEEIVPVRALSNSDVMEVPHDVLEDLEWDHDDTIRHNQKRLAEEVAFDE